MVQVKIEYVPEWGGGGQSAVIAVGKDGKEALLEKHYTGHEEYSHAVSVVWHLKARHRFEEHIGDIIDIWKYDIRSGYPDMDYLKTVPYVTYVSKDSGQNWVKS
jgi:hypothetical protein